MPLALRHAAAACLLALAMAPAQAEDAAPPGGALRLERVPEAGPAPAAPRGRKALLRQRYADVIRAEPERHRDAATKPQPAGAAATAEYYRNGRRLEGDGRTREAIDAYLAAARAGHGPAQKRLGVLYGRGSAEVPRDYAESLQWYQEARRSGEDVAEPLQFVTPRAGQ